MPIWEALQIFILQIYTNRKIIYVYFTDMSSVLVPLVKGGFK